jgi:hypothetical protein
MTGKMLNRYFSHRWAKPGGFAHFCTLVSRINRWKNPLILNIIFRFRMKVIFRWLISAKKLFIAGEKLGVLRIDNSLPIVL